MTTAPETRPGPVGTGTPNTIVHLLCLLCYPDCKVGDKAICGHVGTRGAIPSDPECTVCLDMAESHDAGHRERGEL